MSSLAVAEGATLSCSEGSTESHLHVTNSGSTEVEKKRLAVISDCAYPENVVSDFGTCKKDGKPCIPDLPIPWYPGGITIGLFGVTPVLTNKSVMICMRGGVVRVEDPGTSTVTIDFASTDLPNAIATDSLYYYLYRQADFFFRHGKPPPYPPPYYLDYGDYYLNVFKNLGLSPKGKEWVAKTRRALQELMEEFRKNDPEKFAELERNPDAFRDRAFDTHPKAYADSGFCGLSDADWARIVSALRLKDLADFDTVAQSVKTMGECLKHPGDLIEKGVENVKDRWPLIPLIPFVPPLGPLAFL